MIMELSSFNTLSVVLIVVGILLLGIQIFVFFRIRKSLSQITVFFKFVNRVIKDMEKFQTSATASIQESQQIIQTFQKSSVKSNQKKTCMICKHRVSFLRFDKDSVGFSYHCGQSKTQVSLQDSCSLFELDMESSKP
jgi:hypothetical protein